MQKIFNSSTLPGMKQSPVQSQLQLPPQSQLQQLQPQMQQQQLQPQIQQQQLPPQTTQQFQQQIPPQIQQQIQPQIQQQLQPQLQLQLQPQLQLQLQPQSQLQTHSQQLQLQLQFQHLQPSIQQQHQPHVPLQVPLQFPSQKEQKPTEYNPRKSWILPMKRYYNDGIDTMGPKEFEPNVNPFTASGSNTAVPVSSAGKKRRSSGLDLPSITSFLTKPNETNNNSTGENEIDCQPGRQAIIN